MYKTSFFLFFLSISFAFKAKAQTYQNAESIEYDEAHNRFLIANGNNILARAADGSLSFFGSGSASHGMEVMGENLFALESPQLKAFNLETAEQVMTLNLTGATFLNGLTNDGNGILYATDFSTKKIYRIDVTDLSNPTFEIIVENTVNTPNGILFDGANNRLLFTHWGTNAKIQAVSLSDYSITDVVQTNLGNIDGIDDDSQGNYYISSWSPDRITKYDSNFENPVTIVTPSLDSPADIGYAQAIDTLAIPQGNSADYIGFEVIVINDIDELINNPFNLLVYPNPATDHSWIQFELKEAINLRVRIVDFAGKVYYVSENLEPYGMHKIPVGQLQLGAGQYQVVLEGEGLKATAVLMKL